MLSDLICTASEETKATHHLLQTTVPTYQEIVHFPNEIGPGIVFKASIQYNEVNGKMYASD